MEYGCFIWMSSLQNSVNLTETIQGRFGKMTDCFQSYDNNVQMPITTTSYHEWLKMFNIYSLQRRRNDMSSSTSTSSACTKLRTRNQPQSQKKRKSNIKTEHHQCIPDMDKILKQRKLLFNWSIVIQQYPCYFERAIEWIWRRKIESTKFKTKFGWIS